MTILNYKQINKDDVVSLLSLNTPIFFAPEEKKEFIHYLENVLEDYFVIEENNQILACGGINYFPEEKLARLSWDIVHPNYHGKGLGKLLCQHRINLLKNNSKIDKIVVRTSQFTYKFYEKNRFRLTEVVENYWAKGYHLYKMEM